MDNLKEIISEPVEMISSPGWASISRDGGGDIDSAGYALDEGGCYNPVTYQRSDL